MSGHFVPFLFLRTLMGIVGLGVAAGCVAEVRTPDEDAPEQLKQQSEIIPHWSEGLNAAETEIAALISQLEVAPPIAPELFTKNFRAAINRVRHSKKQRKKMCDVLIIAWGVIDSELANPVSVEGALKDLWNLVLWLAGVPKYGEVDGFGKTRGARLAYTILVEWKGAVFAFTNSDFISDKLPAMHQGMLDILTDGTCYD